MGVLDHTLTPGERGVLAEFARRMREWYGERLERLVVFGSRARGDVTEDSDIDVLAIVKVPLAAETREDSVGWRLLLEAKHAVDEYAPVSLIVFAEERFAELKRRERRFALDVEAEGIPL